MANVFKFAVTVLAVLAFWGAYKVANVLTPPPPPVLDENAYWGPGVPKPDDTTIRPFKINVPNEVLQDLHRRLDQTHNLTPPLEGVHFEYGFNTDTLKKILSFWRKEYKWREREAFLNKFPQFKTQVQGLDIHYIHVKPSTAKRTIPLLLLHGWPGSVREFYSLLPLLTQPRPDADFVFEVVAPSLPGYGFSQAAVRHGLGAAEMAVVFKNLMTRLGHERFYVQGGDWGALIANVLATVYPKNIIGHHSNFCGLLASQSYVKLLLGSLFPPLVVSKEHHDKVYPLSNLFSFNLEEMGYMHLQATKPDTIGIALSDSPAGLAAYILEKFSTWTNPAWKFTPDGGLTNKYTYTDLLDNVMIYWVTGSITTSMRLYSEVFNVRHMSLQIDSIPTKTQTACVKFKNELLYIPDSLIRDKYHRLVQITDVDDGGHFAAFEVPKILADDLWKAVLTDLNHRLEHTRTLTPPLEDINFEYGFNKDTLDKVLTFWRKEYKWRERETFLNKFPQFKTQVQGLDIHYIHVKPSTTKRTIPLLLLHGWPGSVREFYSLLPLLTQPHPDADFVFEVVAPSLPGYGFSQAAVRPGLGAAEMAVVFKNLMKRLGHERFYVQGGDWGSIIGSAISTLFSKNIIGYHSNMCSVQGPLTHIKMFVGSVFPSLIVDKKYEDRMYPLSKIFSNLLEESGYMHLQASKPDTVGVALSDSPAGLAAYILEKFSTWTEPQWKSVKDGGLTNKFTYTDLLDNVMIYWVSGSITTSMRLYAEQLNKRVFAMELDRIPTNVPAACARFKNELMYIPDSLLSDKFTNLVQTNDFDVGGHFAAFEVPQILAKDIWSAFIKIDASNNIDKKRTK